MAESRGGGDKGSSKMLSFAAKKARRVQQKMLERVGKTEKTTDGNYTEFVVNFNKQQLAAARLQKELQKYSVNLKAMSGSTKSLLDVWMEYYEPQWTCQAEVAEIVNNKMLLWEDLLNRVNSDMIESLQLYMSKFPETKKVVEKRERKIVDYDYAKRVLEDTRQKQKVTDLKIQQAEETYHQAKQAFDEVTDSLYEELPTLYDSRIEFYSKFFASMTSVEAKFHEEMGKLDSRYNEIMCKLAEESESGMHTSKKGRTSEPDNTFISLTPSKNSDDESPETSSVNVEDPQTLEGDDNCSESFVSAQGNEGEEGSEDVSLSRTSSGKESPIRSPPSKPQRTDDFIISDSPDNTVNQDVTTNTIESEQPPPKTDSVVSENEPIAEIVQESNENLEDNKNGETISVEGNTDQSEKNTTLDQTDDDHKNINDIPSVLGKRIATHPYTGEDEDELTFDKGDIILIIPYQPQEDEEDEGWNMGIVEATGKKGLFPENFTKSIQ